MHVKHCFRSFAILKLIKRETSFVGAFVTIPLLWLCFFQIKVEDMILASILEISIIIINIYSFNL